MSGIVGRSGRRFASVNNKGLTATEEKLIKHIFNYITVRGGSPPYRWLCDKMGWRSVNAVNQHLFSLERKGLLAWWPPEGRGDGRKIRLPGLMIRYDFSDDFHGRFLMQAVG